MSNVVIDIAAEFSGKKAFKQADTAAGKLSNSVKNVAKSFGLAFGATQLARFGKNAVKAFAQDEQAAMRLGKAVDNLGLGFENTRISNFISDLEKSAAVADDILRPAFQGLISTTGSVAKSQELLSLALDISAGTGFDATEVAKDLSMAYIGQTKSLSKYNTGLTKTELTTAGFAKIQSKLNQQYAGQNATRLDTYTGKMAALDVAFGNAQETIGEGLLESFSILAGNTGIGAATNSMDEFSESIKFALIGLADLTSFEAPSGSKSLFGLLLTPFKRSIEAGPLGALVRAGERATIKPKPFSTPQTISGSTDKQTKIDKARAKAEADAAKRAKEILALTKKDEIAKKNKLSLTKASAIFELNKIQIAAALKNTYDIQEKTRLEALMAIENEDGALAIKKIQELQALQENADMRKLMGIKAISDETLGALNDQLLAELRNINLSEAAEAEKDEMRNIAFGKYNAALAQAGDVMEKSYYSERVQIQLTEIAKYAAASNSVNAIITLERLRMTVSLDVISNIREAQAEADRERYAALLEYIRLLETLGADGVGLRGASDDSIAALLDASRAEADSILIESNAIDAMNRAQALIDNLYNMNGGVPSSARLGANINATDFFNSLSNMNQTSFGGFDPNMNTGARGSVPSQVNYVTVNTAAVGSEDFLARTIQQVIQDINRNGSSTYAAGSLNS
jgi:hypothetical protein